MNQFAKYALLPIAALQFLIPALPSTLGIGENVGEAARADTVGFPPEQPIGAMFSIWGVIFALYLVFAVYAARKNDDLVQRLAGPLALAGAANVAWMLAAQSLQNSDLNFALLWPVAAGAWWSARRFDAMRDRVSGVVSKIADAVTGLLSGWITVAIAISVPLLIRRLTELGASDLPWQMLWITLGVAALGAFAFSNRISRSLWFFAAAGWGLLGIVLNNWIVTEMHWLAIATGLVALLIVYVRLSRGARGAVSAKLRD
jgi:hypothetical protein